MLAGTYKIFSFIHYIQPIIFPNPKSTPPMQSRSFNGYYNTRTLHASLPFMTNKANIMVLMVSKNSLNETKTENSDQDGDVMSHYIFISILQYPWYSIAV